MTDDAKYQLDNFYSPNYIIQISTKYSFDIILFHRAGINVHTLKLGQKNINLRLRLQLELNRYFVFITCATTYYFYKFMSQL